MASSPGRRPPHRRGNARAKLDAPATMSAPEDMGDGAANPDLFDMTHAARLQYQTVLSVLHGFATTICIARNLAASQRELDLSGLSETAGLLCARALDLRPEHGRKLVPRLRSVLEDLDALLTTLAPNEESHTQNGDTRFTKI